MPQYHNGSAVENVIKSTDPGADPLLGWHGKEFQWFTPWQNKQRWHERIKKKSKQEL
jgi:hypothetical protein